MHDVNTLYLVPTMDCHLKCGYCRIVRKQGQQAGFRLSPQEAREAIDHVLGRAPSGAKRTLVLFGGEPLLVPETVFAAISHVRQGPESANTDIMLQTNGIAIDDETAEFLAANDVFIRRGGRPQPVPQACGGGRQLPGVGGGLPQREEARLPDGRQCYGDDGDAGSLR
jgi:hypothetical protein